MPYLICKMVRVSPPKAHSRKKTQKNSSAEIPEKEVDEVRPRRWNESSLQAKTSAPLRFISDCLIEKCWPMWETLYPSNIKLHVQCNRNLKGHMFSQCL